MLHDELIRHSPRQCPTPNVFLGYAVAVAQFAQAPDASLSLMEFSLLNALEQVLLPQDIQASRRYALVREALTDRWVFEASDARGPCSGESLFALSSMDLTAPELAQLRRLWQPLLRAMAGASPLRLSSAGGAAQAVL
jgi:hypothetical protein